MAAGACALAGSAAWGDTVVDLTQGGQQGTIHGARFENAGIRPAGSGVIQSFVRVSTNNTMEQGYNTSGRPVAFNENTTLTFTHDLTLGAIPTVTIGGATYYWFLLDINQNASNPLLSLDDVRIYTSSQGGQTTTNLAALGTSRYQMDGGAGDDNRVELNYNLEAGSGTTDMNMFVPVSFFGGASASTFVYLYSQFGLHNANNDGYEEWAVRTVAVPLPPGAYAGVGTLGVVAIGMGVRRRKHRRHE
jgi:hypothetical protein